MNFKRRLIKELREAMEAEQVTMDDFFEMLEFASTVELSLFKSNLLKLLKAWKETKKTRRALFLH